MDRLSKKERNGTPYFNLKGEIYTGRTANRLSEGEDLIELMEQYNIPDLSTLEAMLKENAEGYMASCPVRMHQKLYRVFAGEIRPLTVCQAIWEMAFNRWKIFCLGGHMSYWKDDFGRTIFYTRQEAEAALEKEKKQ